MDIETTDLEILPAEMPLPLPLPLPLPPAKRRRTGSGSTSSYEPDPNEAEDVSSNVSGEGRVFVETLPASTHRKTLQRGDRKIVKTFKSRRSYRSVSAAPTPQQTYSSRPSRSESRQVRVTLKVKDRISPPRVKDDLDTGELSITPSATFTSRKLRRRNPVRYGFSSQSRPTAEAQNSDTAITAESHTVDYTQRSRHRHMNQDSEGMHQQLDYQNVPKPLSPNASQNRISELEKENAILEEENITLRAQVDELCSRMGTEGPSSLETAMVKDDVFFENGFANLNKMIRDFVREFLQSRFTSPFSPSKVPAKIRDVLNVEGPEWQKHLKGGKNRKVLRAIAQKYISFYLVENIIMDPVFRHNRQLRDAFSTIQMAFTGDSAVRSRWRNRTIQELRSALPARSPDACMIEQKSKELFRDTRVLWVKNQEMREMERLRRIADYAEKLATELHKLPFEIQYGFSRDNWDKLPRDIDTHPEKEFYQINVHSRHSKFQFITVFPGIRKFSGSPGRGEDEDSSAVYLPLQLLAYY
ncbi:hypothetical protein TWF506_010907 [Arthrobotrys conoides]|uniref:Uncharacterized protein n=1 Tax=Arthrobotrys conoides TaxID=74498 RepID=A0AAN8RRP9_9PEZI